GATLPGGCRCQWQSPTRCGYSLRVALHRTPIAGISERVGAAEMTRSPVGVEDEAVERGRRPPRPLADVFGKVPAQLAGRSRFASMTEHEISESWVHERRLRLSEPTTRKVSSMTQTFAWT